MMREELEQVVLKMKEMNLSLEELLNQNKNLGFSEDVVTVIDSTIHQNFRGQTNLWVQDP